MKSVCIFCISFICIAFIYVFFPTHAYARMKATSTYDIRIVIDEKAQARIYYKIVLKNQTSQYFIRDYTLFTTHADLTSLFIQENHKKSEYKKEHREDQEKLKISLRNPLLTKGQSTKLSIAYTTKQVLKKDGLIWYIIIPPIRTEETLKHLKYTIIVPDSYGKISYVSRTDVESKQKKGKKIFDYIRKNPLKEDLFMFGEKQQFEYTYVYKLDNITNQSILYKITLPPDAGYQESYFLHADPMPDASFTDNEGNIIVEYHLKPQESKPVRISGFSKFTVFNKESIIPSNNIPNYLEETRVWNYSQQDVQKVLSELKVNNPSTYDKAHSVYSYLIKKYSLSSIIGKRKKVSSFIRTKKELSCLEFSDSFVALSRSLGVPSRLNVGYSPLLSRNQLLHFWTEFYDNDVGRWIIVDPCIEKTLGYKGFDSFDIDRFVLAYWGLSDQYPEVIIPFTPYQKNFSENLSLKASSYNFDNEQKDINIQMNTGDIDPMTNSIPLYIDVHNTSQRILHLNEIMFDGKRVFLEQFEQGSLYEEAVFPSENKYIKIIFDQLHDNPVERVESYAMSIQATFGSNDVSKEEIFTLSRPMKVSSLISWLVSGLGAFIFLFVIFFIRRKARSSFFRSLIDHVTYYSKRILLRVRSK